MILSWQNIEIGKYHKIEESAQGIEITKNFFNNTAKGTHQKICQFEDIANFNIELENIGGFSWNVYWALWLLVQENIQLFF